MSFLKDLLTSKKNTQDKNRSKKLYEIDDKDRIQFCRYFYEAKVKEIINFIETHNIDVKGYSDAEKTKSLLISAVSDCNSSYNGCENQVNLVNYLIDKGVDINLETYNGYKALEIVLASHSLSNIALILIRTNKADINSLDKHGSNLIFVAIRQYGLTWREEQKAENQLRYEIVEELLKRGADIDKVNKHGISSRTWLERLPENDRLHSLISEYDKNK